MDKAIRELLLEQIKGCKSSVGNALAQNSKDLADHIGDHLEMIDARLNAMRGILSAADWE